MAPAAPTFAFIKIVVGDLDRALQFYETVLGRPATGAFARPGLIEKILAAPAGESGPSIILYHATDGGEIAIGSGWGLIGFRVDDVDALYDLALANGGQSSRAPADFGVLRIAFVLDPDGHEIELIGNDR